jgi:uncharacterized membrane protein YjgN (DUF898 family)
VRCVRAGGSLAQIKVNSLGRGLAEFSAPRIVGTERGTRPMTIYPALSAAGSVPSVTLAELPNVPLRQGPLGDRQQMTPFSWHGSPWHLTGVCLLNTVLLLLTVGVYGFWGRTEIRRRMWSSVRLMGEPLAYHGTPQELLRGFFAVLLVVLLPLFIAGSAVVIFFGQGSPVFGYYQVALFLMFYPIMMAIAYYRARRYRLSRTSWRGVRGSMGGSSSRYGLFSWVTALAYPLTLGWIAPYRAIALQQRLVSETTLGNRMLAFYGSSRSLYGRYALLWFGSIFLYLVALGAIAVAIGMTLSDLSDPLWVQRLQARDWAQIVGTLIGTLLVWSLLSSFYYAKLYNHVAETTVITSAAGQPTVSDRAVHFALNVRGWRLIWLFVSNALITYLSLYILKPVATARSMKYFAENLTIVGPFDPATIGQSLAALDQSGEGLAQAFDLDAF